MKLRTLIAIALVPAAVTAGACALLDEPQQCATDGDCAPFGAVCDVAQAVCVKSGPDMLFVKDGKLFVRCYDTDYVFGLRR